MPYGQDAPAFPVATPTLGAARKPLGYGENDAPAFGALPMSPQTGPRTRPARGPAAVHDVGTAQSLVNTGLRGAAEVALDIPRAIAIQQAQDANALLDAYDKIDRGEKIGLVGRPRISAAATGALGLYESGTPEERAKLRLRATRQRDPANLDLTKLAERGSKAVEEALPVQMEVEQGFGHDLAQGIGSTGGFLATGIAGRALRLPATPVTAATGAASQSAQQFKDAVRGGASLDEAFEAANLGAVVGTAEAIPLARLLSRFDKGTGGTIRKAITEGVKGGIEEGAQEVFQSVASNLIASDLVKYDPERGAFTGAGDQGAVGFTAGALFNVLASMLGARLRTRPDDSGGGPGAQNTNTPPPPSASPEPPMGAPTGTETPPAGPGEQGPAAAPPETGKPVVPPQASDTIVTPRGRKVGVAYEVVEADSLTASQRDDLSNNPAFPKELQPRDRTRAASTEQIANIAGNLEPELLGRSPSAADGAPVVGPDGVVESGNARTIAIRRAYAGNFDSAKRYRVWLQAQGFDVGGMKAPVLIRRRTTELSPEDRAAFTREANERSTAGMSASEQAQADAQAMPDWLLDRYQGGDIGSAGNRDFVRNFLDAVVSEGDRAAVFTAEGGLSQDGRRRVENAIFSRAYGSPDMLAAFRESADPNFTGIGNALVEAAPVWAQMRAQAARNQIPISLDITGDLTAAVNLVRDARRRGLPVGEYLQQVDAFNQPTPATLAILDLMFSDEAKKRPVSRPKLVGALGFYAREAMKAEPGPGLIAMPGVTAEDILQLAKDRGQGGLFDTAAESRLPEVAASRAVTFGRDDAPAFGRNAAQQALPYGQNDSPAFSTGGRERPRIPGLPKGPSEVANGTSGEASGETLGDIAFNAPPGVNYTGFVRDKSNANAPRSLTPMRREDILRRFAKGMGLPFYQGRIRTKNVLGFYRRRVSEVRLRNLNDIEVAAHEMAHALDDKVPEIRRQWLPASKANATVRAELRGVSYDASKLYEGFAEFVRLWMTQTDEARTKAPNFFGWFEDFVARSPYGPTLRQAQQDMTAWFDQNALDRARSKIGVAEEVNAGLVSVADRFRQTVADDLHGIMKMERDLTGELAPAGAYETARLVRGKTAMVEGMLLYGAPVANPDGSHSFKGKGLQQILDPVAERLDDWLLYAVGRSAGELMSQGRENLFTRAEIKAMRALGDNRPEFAQAFNEYQDWNKAVLDFAQAKGVINGAMRATWKRTQYLPFHRVGQPGNHTAVPGNWAGVKALTGGTDNIKDVLHNMIQNASMLIDAALTNEARQKVAALAQRENGAKFMAKIPTEERNIKVHRAEIFRRILEALGVKHFRQLSVEQQAVIDEIMQNFEPFVWLTLKGQVPAGGNVVAVLHDGKPDFYEVADSVLLRSLSNLNRPTRNMVVRILSVPKRIGQATITLTLDFMAANIARDTLMGAIMSRHGFRPAVDSVRGFKSRLLADQSYKDFLANGGGFSSYLVDEEQYRTHLERFYKRKGIDFRTVMHTPAKLLLGLERIADAVEMSTRVGEYRRAIAKGEHPRHAAYSAREVSTDFAMRGDNAAIGFFYDTIIFLKAAMNGMDRLYRGLAHDPNARSIAIKSGLLATASVGLYLLNRGNPLYDDLEDWDKDSHWHFFVPTPAAIHAWAAGKGIESVPLADRYVHLRYPKIWEIGAIATMAERSVERLVDGEPGKLAGDTGRILGNVFGVEYLPQVIAPAVEVAMNRNRFFDRPIEGQGDQELQVWARSGPGTSATIRAYGENVARYMPESLPEWLRSPKQLEALLRGYFNTWATYGLTLSDAVFFDDVPDMRADQYPGLRRFYQSTPSPHSRYVTEFYEMLKEATEARRTMRAMVRSQRPETASEIAETPENIGYGPLGKAQERMQAFNAQMRRVSNTPDLESLQTYALAIAGEKRFAPAIGRMQVSKAWKDLGALKRELLDMWIAERNAYAKFVVKRFEAGE